MDSNNKEFIVSAVTSLEKVIQWLDKEEFSRNEYIYMKRLLLEVEKDVDWLNKELRQRKDIIDREDWGLFIEKLPLLEDEYQEGQAQVYYNGDDWEKDCEEDVYGYPATIYCPQNNVGFLYVFAGGHYYDESLWGEIDLLSKEKMGISDSVVYKQSKESN